MSLTRNTVAHDKISSIINRNPEEEFKTNLFIEICVNDTAHDFDDYPIPPSCNPGDVELGKGGTIEDKIFLKLLKLNGSPEFNYRMKSIQKALHFNPNDRKSINSGKGPIGVTYYDGDYSEFLNNFDGVKYNKLKDFAFEILNRSLTEEESGNNLKPINVLYDAGAGWSTKDWLSFNLNIAGITENHNLLLDDTVWLDPGNKINERIKNQNRNLGLNKNGQDGIKKYNIDDVNTIIIGSNIEVPIYNVCNRNILYVSCIYPESVPPDQKNIYNGGDGMNRVKINYPITSNDDTETIGLIGGISPSEESPNKIVPFKGGILRNDNIEITEFSKDNFNTIQNCIWYQQHNVITMDKRNFIKRSGDHSEAAQVLYYNSVDMKNKFNNRTTYLFTNDRMLFFYSILIDSPVLYDTKKQIDYDKDENKTIKLFSNNKKILRYNPTTKIDEVAIKNQKINLLNDYKKYFEDFIINFISNNLLVAFNSQYPEIINESTIQFLLAQYNEAHPNFQIINDRWKEFKDLVQKSRNIVLQQQIDIQNLLSAIPIYIQLLNSIVSIVVPVNIQIGEQFTMNYNGINIPIIANKSAGETMVITIGINDNFFNELFKLKQRLSIKSILKNLKSDVNSSIVIPGQQPTIVSKLIKYYNQAQTIVDQLIKTAQRVVSVLGRGRNPRKTAGVQNDVKFKIPFILLTIISNFINDEVDYSIIEELTAEEKDYVNSRKNFISSLNNNLQNIKNESISTQFKLPILPKGGKSRDERPNVSRLRQQRINQEKLQRKSRKELKILERREIKSVEEEDGEIENITYEESKDIISLYDYINQVANLFLNLGIDDDYFIYEEDWTNYKSEDPNEINWLNAKRLQKELYLEKITNTITSIKDRIPIRIDINGIKLNYIKLILNTQEENYNLLLRNQGSGIDFYSPYSNIVFDGLGKNLDDEIFKNNLYKLLELFFEEDDSLILNKMQMYLGSGELNIGELINVIGYMENIEFGQENKIKNDSNIKEKVEELLQLYNELDKQDMEISGGNKKIIKKFTKRKNKKINKKFTKRKNKKINKKFTKRKKTNKIFTKRKKNIK